MDIALVLPRVLFVAIPLPLDEELEVVRSHSAVEYLLDFEVLFTFSEDRRGRWSGLSPRDRV